MVLTIDLGKAGTINATYLVLDMNGTISTGGKIDGRLAPILKQIGNYVKVILITADTFGSAVKEAEKYGLECHVLPGKTSEAEEKGSFIDEIGAPTSMAMGNGNNDVKMLEKAALSFGIMGPEGIARDCLLAADIIVHDVADALSMLLEPLKVKATLRS